MESRRLSARGPNVPRIALGTVKLGRNTDVKYPHAFALPSPSEADRLLESAWELGIRMFDTAPAYGVSEERLAPFVARHREEMVLCTKCGENYEDGASSYDFSALGLTRSLERSLRRLGTDYVDLLLLHSNRDDLAILQQTDAIEALVAARRAGTARMIGISAKTDAGIRAATGPLDVIMAPYARGADELADALCAAHGAGMGTMAIKTLGSGHLAASGDENSASAALAHVLSRGFIDVVVVGSLNPVHLAEAVAVATTA